MVAIIARKSCCRKETASWCSYSGRFSLPCCCISFSSCYEYHVDFSTLFPQVCSISGYMPVVRYASKMATVLLPVSEWKPMPWVLWNVTPPLTLWQYTLQRPAVIVFIDLQTPLYTSTVPTQTSQPTAVGNTAIKYTAAHKFFAILRNQWLVGFGNDHRKQTSSQSMKIKNIKF